MSTSPGTLDILARELGTAMAPLADLMGPDLPQLLGLSLPPSVRNAPQVTSAFTQSGRLVGELPPLVAQLTAAIDGQDEGQIISVGGSLIQKVISLISSLKQVGDALDAAAASLAGSDRAALEQFAADFALKTLNFVLINYLDQKAPTLTATLAVLGVVDHEPVTPAPGDSLALAHVRKTIHFDRLVDLLTNTAQHLEDRFDWGKGSFDGALLLPKVQALLATQNLPADLFSLAGKPTLEAYFFSLYANHHNPPGLALDLRVPGNQSFEQTIDLIAPWKATLKTEGTFEAGVMGHLDPPATLSLDPPSGQMSLSVSMGLEAAHPDRPLMFIGQTGGSRLESQSIAGALGFHARWNGSSGAAEAEPQVEAEIKGGKLVIDLSQGDGFLSQILAGFGVEADFDLKGIWTPGAGLRLEGSGGIELLLPVHIDLGIAELNGVYIIGKMGGDAAFELELATDIKANLGPLKAVIERIGVNIPLDFPADTDGNLGPIDLSFGFKPPNGVGLSLDAGVIVGGGYLYFDYDKEEYAGALELTFSGFLSLKAIGLVTTRMPDGSKGFSLLIIITAEFGAGLQLGFGFTLLGVGGLIGLNRTMRLEEIATGIRTGSIDSVMFPTNVVENAPRIISDLRAFFPPEKDRFLIGPMAKFGWGTPTLISLSLGVIFEIRTDQDGGLSKIAIVGVLKMILPDEAAALLVLQVSFIGGIDFEKKYAFFFASMFGSRVLFITIEGEMGLLIGWGNQANFVVSVGGFHPRFDPPPLPFPNPKRVALNVLDTSYGKIRVEGYFATTSNTVQFGAKAELFFGFSAFKIEGHFSFDALMQFDPFYFIIEMSFSVSLKVFGIGLFSISLKLSLEGPTPWRAKGTGKLKLLFFTIKANFDFTWGESRDTTLPPIELMPILIAELNKLENWRVLTPAFNSLSVSLRKLPEATADLVLHPLGTLSVSQRAIPLDLKLDKYGSKRPSDANEFSLTILDADLAKKADLSEQFAIAQFKDLDDSKKLSAPAFEPLEAGIELSVSGDQIRSSRVIERRIRYELITIDNNFKRGRRRFFRHLGALFQHFLKGNAAAKSAKSMATKKLTQPFEAKISVAPEAFVVAFQANNSLFDKETATFTSRVKAEAFMQTQVSQSPALRNELHVIQQFEVTTAA